MSAFALRIVREVTELGTRAGCCVSKAVTFLFRSLPPQHTLAPLISEMGLGTMWRHLRAMLLPARVASPFLLIIRPALRFSWTWKSLCFAGFEGSHLPSHPPYSACPACAGQKLLPSTVSWRSGMEGSRLPATSRPGGKGKGSGTPDITPLATPDASAGLARVPPMMTSFLLSLARAKSWMSH